MVWMLFTSVELDTAGRVLGFAYRSACYLSATILLLYVYNSATELLETRKILWIMSVFWIYVVIGGFLGLMFPSFSFTSPVEAILPRSLLANDFVKLMVHPTFAEVQNFLGFATPRPSAPFVYTNDWGGAYALLTPFMILALGSKLRRRFKTILVATAIASVIPVVLSLNRGLWLSLGLGLMYASFRLALRGRERAIVISVVSVCIVTGLVVFTPLKGLITSDWRWATATIGGRLSMRSRSAARWPHRCSGSGLRGRRRGTRMRRPSEPRGNCGSSCSRMASSERSSSLPSSS